MSLFITFEGGEGSGKSTQAKILADRLESAGVPVLFVREPGSTPLGQHLREWLKREENVTPEAELLLFAAARAELVSKVITPALRQGEIVISDRYADSTVAYQGYGRGIALKYVNTVNAVATQGATPNLTIFLDCPPEIGLERAGLYNSEKPRSRRKTAQEGEKFERESLDFHKRVRAGYQALAAKEPQRWCVIDATGSVEKISTQIWQRIQKVLPYASAGLQAKGRP